MTAENAEVDAEGLDVLWGVALSGGAEESIRERRLAELDSM